MADSCATTATASAPCLKVLAQRASWFRLFPMRASSRVRSRSTEAAAAVQVRVRAMARRSSSDSDTPAARALPRHSASSAADTRTVAVASRAIEVSVTGEGEGGGVIGGPGGNSPGSGFEGAGAPRQPQCITLGRLAPLYYALRRRPRCPASHGPPARRTLPVSRRVPAPAEHLSRYRNRAGIHSLLFRGTRPHGGFRSRTVRSPHNLFLHLSKAVEATAMV